MAREFYYKGKTPDELKEMTLEEFSRIIPSRSRRSLKRGFTERQKKLIEQVKKEPEKFHKTHERDLVIVPSIIGANLG
ncbi:MAG: 30S ribosomal protein S19, partial [Candidatus Aenigmarchaeota archaeon]|nr:30S ribosomal protein S19 [Candidatus Aenigmarchaeota archaeon]